MKYHNQRTPCLSRHEHASKLEANYCNQLRLLVKAKKYKEYTSQVRFPLDINGNHICDIVVDFLVMENNEKLVVHETKGYVTRDWKLKHKMFMALYPRIDFIVIGGQKTWETRRKRTSSR